MLGDANFVYQLSLFVKSPQVGVSIPGHRDLTWTTRATSEPVLAVTFYLDNSNAHNGGTRFLPGTHRATCGRAPMLVLPPSGVPEVAVMLEVSAGEVVVHNLGVLHGSAANRSRRLHRTVYCSMVSSGEVLLCGRWPLPQVAAGICRVGGAKRGAEV